MSDEKLFSVTPSIPGCLFKIVFVIPGLLIPAAILIYFTEGRNAAQFWAITGFGVGLAGLLYGLLALTRASLKKNARIEVTGEGVIRVWNRKGFDEVAPGEVEEMQVAVVRGSMTVLNFRMTDGSRKQLVFAGLLTPEEAAVFEETIGKFGVFVRK